MPPRLERDSDFADNAAEAAAPGPDNLLLAISNTSLQRKKNSKYMHDIEINHMHEVSPTDFKSLSGFFMYFRFYRSCLPLEFESENDRYEHFPTMNCIF